MLIALLIFIIIILFYAFPAAAVIYHLKRYGIKKDRSKAMSNLFIAVSAIMIIIAFCLLITISWEEIFQSISIDNINIP